MKKILVIEDDNSVRMGLIDLLEENGYSVYTAATGTEGIRLAKDILPDLIICDIMMPDIDGYGVIQMLNMESQTSVIPFIFLTAKAEMNDLRKGMAYGASDYITKPYDSFDLLNAIKVRLEKHAEILKQKQSSPAEKTERLTEQDKILLMINEKPTFTKINDISAICAENVYSEVLMENGVAVLARKSLREWEELLPEKIFIRIHRSTIINTNYVKKIEKWFNRSYIVYMKNTEQTFTISQRYAVKLKSSMIR
ncbi:MAG: LytR/AlgR family response regulator transcription factor [Syntrophothermus sp.]